MLNWKELLNSNVLAALLASGVVVVGWNVSSRQSVDEARRQFETRYLVDSFRVVYSVSNVRCMHPSESEALTQAVVDLNIFGTPAQVELAQRFATAMATGGTALADDLLRDLRDELRRELAMDSLEGDDLLLVRFGAPRQCP